MQAIAILVACLAALAAAPARADEIEVRDVQLHAADEGLVLNADFAFELTRRRWYWFDDTAASKRLQLRLSYHALSRQYRLSSGLLQQSFATLDEALNVLKRTRNWLVVERTVTFDDADYEAAVRMRLDPTLLPKPFQLSALTSRDLQLDSPWKRFVVHSPRQLPAPVESREPRTGDR
jgi:hypothetical protein